VEAKTAVPASQQRLVFAGRLLEDSRTVDDYNLLGGTTVHLIVERPKELEPAEPEPAAEEEDDVQLNAGMGDQEALEFALALSQLPSEPSELEPAPAPEFRGTGGVAVEAEAREVDPRYELVAELLARLELVEYLPLCLENELEDGASYFGTSLESVLSCA
jgi:hypothetical protein